MQFKRKNKLSRSAIGKALLWLIYLCAFDLSAQIGYGFIENKNQWPSSIDYVATIPGGNMAIHPGGFNYYFVDYEKMHAIHEQFHISSGEKAITTDSDLRIKARHISVDFLNSNPFSKPIGSKKSTTYFNYFLGKDPQHWGSQAYAFDKITYPDFYADIDLILETKGDDMKYNLIVHAEADPSAICIAYTGAVSLGLFEHDLIIDAELVNITEKRPISYQIINGTKKYISTQYVLVGNELSFTFPDGYDSCRTLIIDPLLIFSTHSGFTADNWGSSATPGERGTLYSSGTTNVFSGGIFGATPGAFDTSDNGGIVDIGLLKYDSMGTQLLYASYLGGGGSESPHSLLMNNNEELLVLGTTGSTDFPVTANAYQTVFRPGGTASTLGIPYTRGADIFVSKISKDGTQLLASTYLGGSGVDGLNVGLSANYGDYLRGDIVVDQSDDIFIASVTSSPNFGASNSFSTIYKGGSSDALVVKLSKDLDEVHWSSFLGGSSSDAAYSIKLNATEDTLFVAGGTSSTDFPATRGAFNTQYFNNADAAGWIAKIDTAGTAIQASTLLSFSVYNQAYFIDLDEDNDVYVYGQKQGDFPITAGTYSNANSGQFLQKYSSDLSALVYSTTFGSGEGNINISPTAFLVNGECGNVYMAGWGGSYNRNNRGLFGQYVMRSSTIGMPTTSDAFQRTTFGSDFYFIALSKNADRLLYATFMGGDRSAIHVDGGTSRFDKRGIVYHAVCAGCGGTSDFPTTAGAWSRRNNSTGCNNAAFKLDLSILKAQIITNSIARNRPNIRQVCLPSKIVFQNRSVGGEAYQWDFGDGTIVNTTNKEDIEHEYLTEGNYSVMLRAVDPQSCFGEDIDQVDITVDLSTGRVSKDRDICQGQSTEIQAGGGVVYSWHIGDQNPFSTSSNLRITPEDTTSYFVTITNARGCAKLDTVTVNVIPDADLQFSIFKKVDCNFRPAIELTNTTLGDKDISVDFGDGNIISVSDRILHEYENDGNYLVRATAENGPCSYRKEENVSIFTVKIPNVITPGISEGLNDTFKILYGKELSSGAGIDVSLSVYNRWGKVVYDAPDYKDDWSAKELEAGVYYYEVTLENKKGCKGWVQVIK